MFGGCVESSQEYAAYLGPQLGLRGTTCRSTVTKIAARRSCIALKSMLVQRRHSVRFTALVYSAPFDSRAATNSAAQPAPHRPHNLPPPSPLTRPMPPIVMGTFSPRITHISRISNVNRLQVRRLMQHRNCSRDVSKIGVLTSYEKPFAAHNAPAMNADAKIN